MSEPTRPLSVRLPVSVIADLDRVAAVEGRSRSNLIARLVAAGVKPRHGAPTTPDLTISLCDIQETARALLEDGLTFPRSPASTRVYPSMADANQNIPEYVALGVVPPAAYDPSGLDGFGSDSGDER